MYIKEQFEAKNVRIINNQKSIWGGACPKCKKISVLANPETGDAFCYCCGFHLNLSGLRKPVLVYDPQDEQIQNAVLQWLQIVKLNAVENIGQGIHYYPEENKWEHSIKFFCKTSNEVQNIIGLKKDFNFYGTDNIDEVFNKENLGKEIIIVDHPLDFLAIYNAGFKSVTFPPRPLNDTENSWNFLKKIEEAIQGAEKVVLAFSDINKRYEEEIGRRIGKEKCYKVKWNLPELIENKFLNIPRAAKAFYLLGADFIKESLEKASPFPINGIYELSDVNDEFEVLYTFGLQPGLSTGWPSLNDLYTVKPGQWTLITGIPNHGKSNFLDHLLVNMATNHDWRIGLFSPETQPIERHFVSLTEKYMGMPFLGKHKMSPTEKDKAKLFVQDHFKTILPEDDMNWSVDGILELAKILVYRYGIRGLVIDPWNELDHTRSSGMSETEHISKSLSKVRRFARVYDLHVWLVAHPTKLYRDSDGKYPVPTLYDVNGGAHWRNKADNGLVVWRNVGGIDDDVLDIHVQKIRFKEIGRVGMTSLRIDRDCGRCIDDINHDLRKKSSESMDPQASSLIRLFAPREEKIETQNLPF